MAPVVEGSDSPNGAWGSSVGNAASDPVVHDAEGRDVYVCGDCAGVLLEHESIKRSKTPEIALGRCCDLHPAALPDMQATSILAVPIDIGDVPLRALIAHRLVGGADIAAPPEEPHPSPWGPLLGAPDPSLATFGPVTEAALRLLVALAAHDKGMGIDDVAIERCVHVARKLLVKTGGQ